MAKMHQPIEETMAASCREKAGTKFLASFLSSVPLLPLSRVSSVLHWKLSPEFGTALGQMFSNRNRILKLLFIFERDLDSFLVQIKCWFPPFYLFIFNRRVMASCGEQVFMPEREQKSWLTFFGLKVVNRKELCSLICRAVTCPPRISGNFI